MNDNKTDYLPVVPRTAAALIHQDLLIMDIIKNKKDIQNVRYNFFNVGEMSPPANDG